MLNNEQFLFKPGKTLWLVTLEAMVEYHHPVTRG